MLRRSSLIADFWGKGKTVMDENRDIRGILSTKTRQMGENVFQSPLFGYFAFKNYKNRQN